MFVQSGDMSLPFYQYNDGSPFYNYCAVSLDLTLSPLHRLNGQEQASLPGLMAATPPRKAARGRERDRLVVYLLLTGNAAFSTGEYMQLASRAAVQFYGTPGTLTSALRAAAETINRPLLERNMGTSGRGQYVVGWLTLAAFRESQCTLLLSGPMHAFLFNAGGAQRIYDTLSGKGLGLSPSAAHYFSQVSLQPGDRLLFCGKVPAAWKTALSDSSPSSLDAMRRRLLTLTDDDLNAVLLQAAEGNGALTVLRPGAEPPSVKQPVPLPPPAPTLQATPHGDASDLPPLQEAEPTLPPASVHPAAHIVQPSAYAIPVQREEEPPLTSEPSAAHDLPPSIPRVQPSEPPLPEEVPSIPKLEPAAQRVPSGRTRQTAKALVGGMQAWRRVTERVGAGLQKFLPRLLPSAEAQSLSLPSSMMIFISLLIPLIVVTVASVVYFRYGRSVQYENYLLQAQNARTQAVGQSDPAAQRDAWQAVLFYLDKAESYNETTETNTLRQEAQSSLDTLLGIARLQFTPAFSSGLGIQISRLAANESDLYMLDAERGELLRAALTTGRGLEEDNAFNCTPGPYGGYQVGPLVDILALPRLNSVNAAVLGVDAGGNLLYCAPGQVPQAIPLPPPDTNWGRVTAFTLDNGNLYVLDAPARAVWVYTGKDGAFVDRPYFFFGGQIPEIQDAIDLAVSGDDLYILHADGHLSTCSYSRIETVPTRCEDVAKLVNLFPAYRDVDLFAQSHFTQMVFTPAPDSALLMLDADSQGVFRFSPRSLELQNQLRPAAGRSNPLPPGPVGAMTIGPNHILYLAIKDQVYFATDLP